MFLKRLFGRRSKQPLKVIAAATSQFPVYSHTFVYTELMALHEMLGADIKLIHWNDGPADDLHAAFQYLNDNKLQIESIYETHVADLEHYRRSRPGRLESLLERLSSESGMSIAELEDNYQIKAACTFVRHVEAFAPDYLQTYFFYEQSLYGLFSQWLLDIPRGMTAYADHMLDDYPLKVIPLHLETADIVVATSKRIKQELIQKGGSTHADKIIVKPNGVDGRRFPFKPRETSSNRTLELISISRIEPKKGMIELCEAMKILKDRGHDVKVHVIGSADPGCAGSESYADRFANARKELGVESMFEMHGLMKQEDMRPVQDRVQAFIAPYVETENGDKDGIPTAILEALSCGMPIITTDAGSILEIVDDGVEGLVVPQKQPTALASAIEKLLVDSGLTDRLSKKARERFESEFDFHVTEQILHQQIQQSLRMRV